MPSGRSPTLASRARRLRNALSPAE
ncbi:MAG: hypothetical protein QOF29_1651, partial [bacterium]